MENSQEVFSCSVSKCGKKFTTRFSLKRHQYIHKQQKNYECGQCGKKFVLPQYLKEHSFIHNEEDPFVCGVSGCQESFKQRGKLSLHRRTHQEFQKKSYRLLNKEINQEKKDKRIKKKRLRKEKGSSASNVQTDQFSSLPHTELSFHEDDSESDSELDSSSNSQSQTMKRDGSKEKMCRQGTFSNDVAPNNVEAQDIEMNIEDHSPNNLKSQKMNENRGEEELKQGGLREVILPRLKPISVKIYSQKELNLSYDDDSSIEEDSHEADSKISNSENQTAGKSLPTMPLPNNPGGIPANPASVEQLLKNLQSQLTLQTSAPLLRLGQTNLLQSQPQGAIQALAQLSGLPNAQTLTTQLLKGLQNQIGGLQPKSGGQSLKQAQKSPTQALQEQLIFQNMLILENLQLKQQLIQQKIQQDLERLQKGRTDSNSTRDALT